MTDEQRASGRQYLRVEQLEYSPEFTTDIQHYILSPPPISLPHGIGYTGEGIADSFTVLDGWVKEDGPDVVPKSGMMARKCDVYCEQFFTGFVPIWGHIIWISVIIFFSTLAYNFLTITWFLFTAVPFVVLYIAISFFDVKNMAPSVIYNKMRGDIYIYDEGYLRIQHFNTTCFILRVASPTSASFRIDTKAMHPRKKMRGVIHIAGSRGRNTIVPHWEYIRRYMDSGDANKNLLTPDEVYSTCDPISRFFHKIETTYLSPPHRWPPEIEALLLPENKDAPLPDGWEYDTWIPCKMPWRGFDNTKQQKGRPT